MLSILATNNFNLLTVSASSEIILCAPFVNLSISAVSFHVIFVSPGSKVVSTFFNLFSTMGFSTSFNCKIIVLY